MKHSETILISNIFIECNKNQISTPQQKKNDYIVSVSHLTKNEGDATLERESDNFRNALNST